MCTALTVDSVRVVWMYDWSTVKEILEEKEIYVYYVVSWFTIDDVKENDENYFRKTVDYQYNSEILRYSDMTQN